MILEALYRYYEILLKDEALGIAPPGYTAANVSFALNLSLDGDLIEILPFASKFFDGRRERETKYRRMVVPEQVKRAGIDPKPNFLCDNSTFVLGISDRKTKDGKEDGEYINKRFDAFRKHNLELLSKANSEAARTVIAFLKKYDPQTARQQPVVARNLDALLEGGILIFRVQGKDALEDPEIRRVWEEYKAGSEAVEMQCLVSGKKEPIARLHPNIQGVRDANTTGASLVGFNERAYESYNRIKGQGLNSPVSQRIASGYGVALNYLLSPQNPNPKIRLGNTTVVYWAESENKGYANAFAALLDPEFTRQITDTQAGRQEAEKNLAEKARKVQQVQPMDLSALSEGLDGSTRFYVLGLAPNAARLAVRFFLSDSFAAFARRIMLHYEDLKISKEFPDQPEYISPFKILRECVSPKVTRYEEAVKDYLSLLSGSLMRSILTGGPYPEELYFSILNRIRSDSEKTKINYVRAAIIKAHLLRKYRRRPANPFQEVLQMSLNDQFDHPAYVLGRLFAVLEKAQTEAIGEVNAGIRDRYFTAACATPASVFPTLLRLSHHHTAKAEYGRSLDYRIEQLLNQLEAKPFPARLTLDEQGIFVLGYYHQKADFYIKSSEKAAEPVASMN